MTQAARIGVVVIGRNEGERLKRCLASISGMALLVYVDSGSHDGSLEYARSQGIEAVALSTDKPFTAARARNAGLGRLLELEPELEWLQTVDGDCTLHPGWLGAGVAALQANPKASTVFGRLRELNAGANIYLRICDDEWNVPVGEAESCGGIALHRMAAIAPIGGFDESLIAGEEPELCMRLKKAGWSIHRIDDEMGVHDAAIYRFGQYWQRSVRSGYGYTEHLYRHRGGSLPSWKKQVVRFTFWGIVLPMTVIVGTIGMAINDLPLWLGLLPLCAYPLQFMRFAYRNSKSGKNGSAAAALSVASKFAEAQGALRFVWRLLLGKGPKLIEYKS
jgi:glycosyltransferase involved in cell wall biosynthesis